MPHAKVFRCCQLGEQQAFLQFPIIKGNTIKGWVRIGSVRGIKPFRMIGKNIKAINIRLIAKMKTAFKKDWNKK